MAIDLKSTPHHSLLEDAQGLTAAAIQAALGIHLLRAAGLITGGTAGVALLLSYATGWGFGATFFTVNLPFYAFAWMRRGPAFAVKSFVTVTAVSLLAGILVRWVPLTGIHPAAAAILFGVVAGVGLLGLFRHASSLGGVSIVALILQDRFGIRAGWVQLGFDLGIFLIALTILPAERVLWSALGALILNFILAMNHRRDWYIVT
ncbi:YitT family protein [Gemmobacter lutimaris]|uniref:YitT family protein n=1 Tax=Gemmobacter lutimaris TaxID=2306023 RepID=A0A398BV25_9RHOB|nr:YitT family protein [Gemmobacter lutimaris]RID93397.1 YitT family protein [Gemmobacter lutimaris]